MTTNSRARSLVEMVVSGETPSRVLLEAETTPAWKAGEPVPKGYRVVFGHLAKVGSPLGGSHYRAMGVSFRDSGQGMGAEETVHHNGEPKGRIRKAPGKGLYQVRKSGTTFSKPMSFDDAVHHISQQHEQGGGHLYY